MQITACAGYGRTTLLRQFAAAARDSGAQVASAFGSPQAEGADPVITALMAALTDSHADGSDPIDIVLEALAQRHGADGAAIWILLDDFDRLIEFGAVELVNALIARVPELRVVTVTVGAGGLRAHGAGSWAIDDGVERILAADLEFTRAEAATVFRNSIEAAGSGDADPATVSRMYASTRGLPLAVALAADRWIAPIVNRTEGFQVGLAMAAVCVESARALPARELQRGFLGVAGSMSLMPRFTVREIHQLFPGVDAEALRELGASPAVARDRAHRTDEFVWAPSVWSVFSSHRGDEGGRRHRAADVFLGIGEVAAAFEQRYLSNDLAGAERLFRERPMSVYECLSPESADSLRADTDEVLAEYPWLRALRTLLGSDNAASLRSVRRWLREFRGDGAPFEISATAASLEAAISLRLGDTAGAQSSSEFVLEQSRLNPRTGAAVPEARLIATQVSIRCGESWSLVEPGPEITGRLAALSADTSRYLLRSRCVKDASMDHPIDDEDQPASLSYRSLVLSQSELRRRIRALRDLDALMVGPREGGPGEKAGRGGVPAMSPELQPDIHGPLGAVIGAGRRLSQDRARATVHASGDAVPERITDRIVDAMTWLSTGQCERVLALVGEFECSHPRVRAMIAFLRLGALVAADSPRLTSAMIEECVSLPEPARVFAATLLPEAVLTAIAEKIPALAPTARRALEVGVAGTGLVIHGGQRIVGLSERERQVVSAMKRGLTLEAIAREQFVSLNTVKTQARSAAKKLDARGREQLVEIATTLGLID